MGIILICFCSVAWLSLIMANVVEVRSRDSKDLDWLFFGCIGFSIGVNLLVLSVGLWRILLGVSCKMKRRYYYDKYSEGSYVY